MSGPKVMRESKRLMSKGASVNITTRRSSFFQMLKGESACKGIFRTLYAFPCCRRPPHKPCKIWNGMRLRVCGANSLLVWMGLCIVQNEICGDSDKIILQPMSCPKGWLCMLSCRVSDSSFAGPHKSWYHFGLCSVQVKHKRDVNPNFWGFPTQIPFQSPDEY